MHVKARTASKTLISHLGGALLLPGEQDSKMTLKVADLGLATVLRPANQLTDMMSVTCGE
jgi:hypothetical protein